MPAPALTPAVRALYEAHGAVLAKYPVTLLQLARELGVSINTLRLAAQAAHVLGPPAAPAPTRPPEGQGKATHLVIPDAHAHPHDALGRFRLLGRVVADYAARYPGLRVVCLGDWGDYDSLCSFDKGKRDFDARSLAADVAAATDALAAFQGAASAEVWASVKRYFVPGNHENRVQKLLDSDEGRLVDGFVEAPEALWAREGWEVRPFLVPLDVDGVLYAHYFTTGVMNRPCNGAKAQLSKTLCSTVAGHSHMWDVATATAANGRKMHAIQAGVYYDGDMGFAGPANSLWWRGLTVLHGVENGQIEDVEQVSLQRLWRTYGR